MTESRAEWLDVAKGIGILLVVLGHTNPPFVEYIYGFHMPVFFIMSGMLFKKKKNIYAYSITLLKRYLVPYFVLCFFNLVIWVVVTGNLDNVGKYFWGIVYSRGTTEWMPNCSPLWFLTCLAVALFIFNIIQHIENQTIIGVLIILCVGVSYYLDYFHYKKMFWNIDTALMTIIFLELGYIIYLHHEKIKTILQKRVVLAWSLMLLIGLVCIKKNSKSGMVNFDENSYGNLGLMIIGAMLVSLTFLYICYSVTPKLKNIKKILIFYGKHSILIMGFDYLSGTIIHVLLARMNLLNYFVYFIGKIILLTSVIAIYSLFVEEKCRNIRSVVTNRR